MTTSEDDIRMTVHAEQRRQERRVTSQAVYQAVTDGKAIRTATGRRYVSPDGTHVITDPTGKAVITVLGRIEAAAHDRDGGGISRHRKDRPKTRTDQRRPRR